MDTEMEGERGRGREVIRMDYEGFSGNTRGLESREVPKCTGSNPDHGPSVGKKASFLRVTVPQRVGF
ncbi:hypothetical protein E2C01_046073 [Portunus trituberculatus]|uniref:Uncharacterized protein n=1 Tax=Portunus trituberculatus TaxID=210409 RepID=A0A5B7FWU6_PORTR|nr:hypothetical protein [Portunus trituberculatus]